MKPSLHALAVALVVAVVIGASAATGDKKDAKKKGLQIGIKKRVDPEDCKVKSKKGDSLHMHYTVTCFCSSHCSKTDLSSMSCLSGLTDFLVLR